MPLREVRDALGMRVDAAHYADENTIITRVGKPHAVIVSWDWYRELIARGNLGQTLGQTSTRTHHDPPRADVAETGGGLHGHRDPSRSTTDEQNP